MINTGYEALFVQRIFHRCSFNFKICFNLNKCCISLFLRCHKVLGGENQGVIKLGQNFMLTLVHKLHTLNLITKQLNA